MARGNNYFGQLGHAKRSALSTTFHDVRCDLRSTDNYIEYVETCNQSSFIITTIGEVYSFGKNKKGMLRY